jgi:hypothetical protein
VLLELSQAQRPPQLGGRLSLEEDQRARALTRLGRLLQAAGPCFDGVSTAKACHRSSSDLHGHANHPSRHDHCRPGDVRIVAEYNHAHRSKRREPREKRAQRAQEFRGVDLLVRL